MNGCMCYVTNGRYDPVGNARRNGYDLKALAKVLGVTTDPGDDPAGFIRDLLGAMDEVEASFTGESEPDEGAGGGSSGDYADQTAAPVQNRAGIGYATTRYNPARLALNVSPRGGPLLPPNTNEVIVNLRLKELADLEERRRRSMPRDDVGECGCTEPAGSYPMY